MSRRRLAGALVATFALLAIPPQEVAAHAIGDTFRLPVPLWLYLWGAAAAVAASFVVAVVVATPPGPEPRYPRLTLPRLPAGIGARILQILGLAWWLGGVVSGILLGDATFLPAVLFWIGIWVGLPMVCVIVGNPWPALSPFRTLFGLLEGGARLLGFDRLDLGLRYPAGLARWPAVLLLAATLWAELVLPGGAAGSTVATLLISYTLLTLAGMVTFGRLAWLRNAELFEILYGWFGRIGPVGRRVVVADTCTGCADECDPARCIDCPDCTAAAEPGEQRMELRPWFTGLTEVRHAGWSDAAFIVLALAGVTYDGLQETALWGQALNALFPALMGTVGPLWAIVGADTIGLLATSAIFLAAFVLAATLTRALSDRTEQLRLGNTAGAYASTLLPIAAGYLIAHYLTIVVQAAAWLPQLIRDPIFSVAPMLDWVSAEFVWYLSVGGIVVGHVAAVVLAHRLALRDAPRRPALAGLPLVLLMIGYTIASLWIIAQPIVIDPGIDLTGAAR
jgi:hypothetical protein